MIDFDQVVEDTKALIGIESTNPGRLEADVADWCEKRLESVGLEVTRHPVQPGRDNLAVVVPGRDREAPRLVLVAHMDTVPVGDGWTRPPLEATVEDGLLYGRGSCDMKAGLATSLGLVEALVSTGTTPAADVVLFLTVDEEAPGMLGAHQLVADGLIREDDQILAPEPSGMRLRISQMGLRWLWLKVEGRMAHAGRAHLGINANHVLARIIADVETSVRALPFQDEILGAARFTCGTMNGGVATNVVPATAEAHLDLRIVPPLLPDDIVRLVDEVARTVVAQYPGATYEIGLLGASRRPVRASDESKIVRSIRRSHQVLTGAAPEVGGADGHEAYTDSAMIAALMDLDSSTVLGPGATDQAHTADEFVPLDDIELCCRIMWHMVSTW